VVSDDDDDTSPLLLPDVITEGRPVSLQLDSMALSFCPNKVLIEFCVAALSAAAEELSLDALASSSDGQLQC
jgi:hypothetical protein